MKINRIRELGRGGFGIVDLVEDETGRQMARKTFQPAANLPSDLVDNVRRRFAREAKTQSGIKHKNIVPVIYAELHEDPPYYLMPLATCSLQDDLVQDKTLGGDWIAALTDIVEALDELHGAQIFHRDLKPQNVLRFENEDGSSYYAVSDFGLIAMNESRVSQLTTTGMGRSTDYYTAPEITSNLRQASAQSDIYSLGCILHEVVGTGNRVPCAEIREASEYAAILRNCTRPDPSRRFRSVRSVLDSINSISSEVPSAAVPKDAEYSAHLESGEPLEIPEWKALLSVLEDDKGSEAARAILVRLRLDQVADVCAKSPDCGDRLGLAFSSWVHENSFGFERCDGLANILQVFAATSSFDVKTDALMAMLEMGTSHNRWYVEHKFCELCGPKMDETLARRLAIEFRAAGADVCRSIRHLEGSISLDRTAFHPVLQQTLAEVCP